MQQEVSRRTLPPTRQLDVAGVLATASNGKRRRLWLWGILSLLLLAGGTAYWLAEDSRPTMRFITSPATRGDLTVLVTATGTVQPLNKVDVSSEQSGTVRKVLVDFNSVVKPGQILAELDTERLDATLRSSEAKLKSAQAQVTVTEATEAEAKTEFARKQDLADRQISSLRELEQAQAAHRRAVALLAAARAQLAVAEAEVRVNHINLERAVIRSPIGGVVLRRNVDPGQTVAVTLQAPVMFTIAEDLAQMELQVDIDEADVGRIHPGQDARFTVDAHPDRQFPARIRDIRFGAEVIQGVVTYKAVLTIDNTDLLLRPGMTATAEIVTREVKDALLVPNPALRFTPPEEPAKRSWLRTMMPGIPTFRAASKPETHGPERTIWVDQNGQAIAVPVTIGATDGKRTEIVKGDLAAGAPVIIDAKPR